MLQAVLTGYFNFTQPKPLGFKSFYVASSKYLQHDGHRSVAFAAITDPSTASAIGIDPHLPADHHHHRPYDIRLHLWNETLVKDGAKHLRPL